MHPSLIVFSKSITRREVLLLWGRMLAVVAGGKFLDGCQRLESPKPPRSQLPVILTYLLYGDQASSQTVEKIRSHMEKTVKPSLEEQLELEILSSLDGRSFQNLTPEDKKNLFSKSLLKLMLHPQFIFFIKSYLKGDKVLEYLDYPDLIGEYGECGWLVMEGAIWDRYYPPSDR